MISKLAKAKDNWFFKIISIAVAVSFVSLFGVTGYISTASQNQTVVNVNGEKTSQSEFSYRLQKELSAIKGIAGEDFEITDEMRNTLAEGVLRQIVNESVIDQAMVKYGIHFPKAFVQQVIFNRPEFMNPANGQFHPELFKRYLSSVGMSENEYVASIKRMMAQKLLVADMVADFGVPQVLSNAIHKMDNQRKSFKYVTISPADIKIERAITEDEIRQYYDDFSENFTIPETREAEVLFIPNEIILKKFAASDEMVEDYFKQHKKELDQPEKREVLQMVFTDKAIAEKAFEQVKNGKIFADVAKELKAENAAEPTLGLVSQDELADDLANNVFDLELHTPTLLEVADSWQVISVKNVIPAKEAVFAEVKQEIIELLQNENLYDALREAKAEIDDASNAGKSLTEIGAMYAVQPIVIKDIREETPVTETPESLQTLDFNEIVFSYGQDEVSSAEEFDDGVALVKVIKIIDAHLPEMDTIKEQIIALWSVQEKNALAKEMAENIINDTEDGSELADAAKARNLEIFRSEPLSRNETFAGLSKSEINDLFLTEEGRVMLFERAGNAYILATPFETVNFKDELTEDKLADIQERAKASIAADMGKAAMDSYTSDYKVKIDYDLAGFSE
ncbi:MAG: SurA N-terminal domain-containing protein [Acetobacter sp.]|nr:SurA N-terminal domain-containing protein [Acetobacter sp.]